MSKKYTKEQIETLKKYYPSGNYDEIFKLFPNYTKREITTIAHNHKIKMTEPNKIKDIIGLRSDKLVVKKMLPRYKGGNRTYCECDCDCGGTKICQANYITSGRAKNCGCERGKKRQKDFIFSDGDILDDLNSGKLLITGTIRKTFIKKNGVKNSRKYYLYKCLICGDENEIQEEVLRRGSGCAVCANQKLKIGFNDMWTTDPEIASLLANPQEGYENMRSTNKRLNWKCPDCGYIVKNRSVNQISTERHISCPKCSDGVSYPNKFMYHILKALEENFENEYSPEWIKPKRYDFALFNENGKYIIEMDGGLGHGKRVFDEKNTRENSKEADDYKDTIASKKGFVVIRIDCDYGSSNRFEFIKESILKSEIKNILDLDNIDFVEIDKRCQKSIIRDCCDLYNNGVIRTEDIANKLNIHRGTVTRYLNKGRKIGWCNYNPKKVKRRYRPVDESYKYKAVEQYDLNMNYLNTYESVTIAAKLFNVCKTSISACCRGRIKTCAGYIWKFADDNREIQPYKNGHYIPVCQIDLQTREIINTYPYIQDAYRKTGVCASCIGECCRGKRKTAGGYIWEYADEVENRYNI